MPMLCPVDKNPLSVRTTAGHVGYVCGACSGIWLPQRYLQSIEHNHQFSSEALFSALSSQDKQVSHLHCPSGCGLLLQAHSADLLLDWCPQCHSIWFDRGEIDRFLLNCPVKTTPREKLGPWDWLYVLLSML